MSDDPKPRIDDLLSAYAASRKQTLGNPPALHPAQKRILMGEVSKKFRRRPARFSLAILWPKLAFSVATLFMLAGFVLFIREAGKPSAFVVAGLRPDSASTQLGLALLDAESTRGRSLERFRRVPEQSHRELDAAFDTPPSIRMDTLSTADTKTDAAKRLASSADRAPIAKSLGDRDTRGEAQIAENRSKAKLSTATPSLNPSSPAPQTPLASSTVVLHDNIELKMEEKLKAADASVVNEPAPTPSGASSGSIVNRGYVSNAPEKPVASPAELPALSKSRGLEAKKTGIVSLSEKEALSYGANLQSITASDPAVLPLLPLLSEFQLKRNGSAIEIVDYDGSVYSGNVTTNAALSENPKASSGLKDKFYKEAVTENRHGEQSELYQFAVSGTNVTLGKPVLLTGHYYFYTPPNKDANLAMETLGDAPGLQKVEGVDQSQEAVTRLGRRVTTNTVADAFGGRGGGATWAAPTAGLAGGITVVDSNQIQFYSRYSVLATNKNSASTNKTVETGITIEGQLKIGTNTSSLKAQKLP